MEDDKQQADSGTVKKLTNGSGTTVQPEGTDLLSLDDIAEVQDVRYEYITVPEWGRNGRPAVVRIGSLSAEDMIEFVESNEGPGKRTAGLRLIVQSLVNENGDRIGNMQVHLQMLKQKDSVVINRVVEAILKMNGMMKKKDRDAEGNVSAGADSGASPTVLH